MKLLLLALLSAVLTFGQTAAPTPSTTTSSPGIASPTSWSGFVEGGAQSGKNITSGIGIATTVAANTQIFLELTSTTQSGVAAVTGVMFGVKTDLPTVRSITPFTIVGYGGSISSLSKLTSLPSSVTGVNAASVTAVGTAVGFAQQYAAGGEYKLKNGLTIGVGAEVNKSSPAWKGYPFVFVGKEF